MAADMGYHLDNILPIQFGFQTGFLLHGVDTGQDGSDIVIAKVQRIVEHHKERQLAGMIGTAEPGDITYAGLDRRQPVLMFRQ